MGFKGSKFVQELIIRKGMLVDPATDALKEAVDFKGAEEKVTGGGWRRAGALLFVSIGFMISGNAMAQSTGAAEDTFSGERDAKHLILDNVPGFDGAKISEVQSAEGNFTVTMAGDGSKAVMTGQDDVTPDGHLNIDEIDKATITTKDGYKIAIAAVDVDGDGDNEFKVTVKGANGHLNTTTHVDDIQAAIDFSNVMQEVQTRTAVSLVSDFLGDSVRIAGEFNVAETGFNGQLLKASGQDGTAVTLGLITGSTALDDGALNVRDVNEVRMTFTSPDGEVQTGVAKLAQGGGYSVQMPGETKAVKIGSFDELLLNISDASGLRAYQPTAEAAGQSYEATPDYDVDAEVTVPVSSPVTETVEEVREAAGPGPATEDPPSYQEITEVAPAPKPVPLGDNPSAIRLLAASVDGDVTPVKAYQGDAGVVGEILEFQGENGETVRIGFVGKPSSASGTLNAGDVNMVHINITDANGHVSKGMAKASPGGFMVIMDHEGGAVSDPSHQKNLAGVIQQVASSVGVDKPLPAAAPAAKPLKMGM